MGWWWRKPPFWGLVSPLRSRLAGRGGASGCSAGGRLGGGELGHGLGALGHSVLGELPGEEEADSGLDLSAGEGVLLVVSDELAGLKGDLLEDVVDEAVHDVHGSLGDASLGVDLLEDSVDVHGEGLSSLSVCLVCSLGNNLLSGVLGSGGALGGTDSLLGSHFEN